MGDLFWNKVAGAVLAVGLLILGLQTLGHELMDSDSAELESLAYPVDLAAIGASMGSDEAEEPAGPPDFGTLLASADVSAGERVARRCASCHSFDAGGRNGTGPALYGVMGRDVGSVEGFRYSGAMLEYAEGGVEWMYQNMYDYLESPGGYVPGTAMSFAGLRDQEDRINIIAYMRSLDDDPIALPEPRAEEAVAEDMGEVEAADEAVGDADAAEGEPAEGGENG